MGEIFFVLFRKEFMSALDYVSHEKLLFTYFYTLEML